MKQQTKDYQNETGSNTKPSVNDTSSPNLWPLEAVVCVCSFFNGTSAEANMLI